MEIKTSNTKFPCWDWVLMLLQSVTGTHLDRKFISKKFLNVYCKHWHSFFHNIFVVNICIQNNTKASLSLSPTGMFGQKQNSLHLQQKHKEVLFLSSHPKRHIFTCQICLCFCCMQQQAMNIRASSRINKHNILVQCTDIHSFCYWM